jgi:hypothetical protein
MKKIISSSLLFTSLVSINYAQAAELEDEWQFTFVPLFVWGSNLNGSAQAGPQALPLDLDFQDDLLENLDLVFTFHFEAQKNRWIFFAEYQNMELTPTVSGPQGGDINVTFKNRMAELGLGYVLSSTANVDYEILGGVRSMGQDIKLDLPENAPSSISIGDDWYDAFIGGRIKSHLSNEWMFVLRGDIGIGGSDFAWNTAAQFNYRFADWGSAVLGYRAMGYEFDNNDNGLSRYSIDVIMQGPLIGLNLNW